jgi:hypothetical protein
MELQLLTELKSVDPLICTHRPGLCQVGSTRVHTVHLFPTCLPYAYQSSHSAAARPP